jgi:hypothetical protein
LWSLVDITVDDRGFGVAGPSNIRFVAVSHLKPDCAGFAVRSDIEPFSCPSGDQDHFR